MNKSKRTGMHFALTTYFFGNLPYNRVGLTLLDMRVTSEVRQQSVRASNSKSP